MGGKSGGREETYSVVIVVNLQAQAALNETAWRPDGDW